MICYTALNPSGFLLFGELAVVFTLKQTIGDILKSRAWIKANGARIIPVAMVTSLLSHSDSPFLILLLSAL